MEKARVLTLALRGGVDGANSMDDLFAGEVVCASDLLVIRQNLVAYPII